MRNPLRKKEAEARDGQQISLQDYIDLVTSFQFGGNGYSVPVNQTSPGVRQENIDATYGSVSALAYRGNPIVFSCIGFRMDTFSEARFQYRRLQKGRPSELFGDKSLALLENPWPGGTTGDLLAKMLLHADLAGNAFVVNRRTHLALLRPDWVGILLGVPDRPDASPDDVDAQVVGYAYYEGGRGRASEPEFFLPEQVAHFNGNRPDPLARYRGMSWLTPVIREVMADKALTDYKLSFLENGATPNLVVKFDAPDVTAFNNWIDAFETNNTGARNAFKTMWLAAGADATVVGTNLKDLDMKSVQGAGETRIASAASVPPILVGLSEGLASATYSNYGMARRRFADATLRPLWRNAAGSLQHLFNVPPGAQLWYDDRDIPFLQEDKKDEADIRQADAVTIQTLVTAGYEPDSVVAAVAANNMDLLVHSGLVSVQLQPPGAVLPPSRAKETYALREQQRLELTAAPVE